MPEGLKEASRICAFVAGDFAGLPVCWQATNEMHIVHFRAPLNVGQAREFIIACIRSLQQGNPAAAVGHNSVSYDWTELGAEIERWVPCDYVGLDCYDGTWTEGGVDSCREKIDQIFLSFFPHLLKKWAPAAQIPHTEEGQALFYSKMLPMLQLHPAVGGAVIYCWQDSGKCFLCGESDCPCETAWGLLRKDGSKKPAYEAVRRAFRWPG